jgi:hypothetical protein
MTHRHFRFGVIAAAGDLIHSPIYSIELKPSARKELDALDDAQFARVDRKIRALADNPRPAGCKKLKGTPTSGASGRATIARSTSLTMRRRS